MNEAQSNPAALARMFGSSEMLVGMGFLGVVVLLVIPLPPPALDLLLAASIGLSVVVFLTALFISRPTDFSVFPPLLLIATLLRLSLNVASTRLILLRGHEGPDAAGRIIHAFGSFAVGGNVGVGIIVFLTLVVINFVVITKGAGRIAEVAARFTLDAMPGKQMAIDAELNAGSINDAEARARRAEIERQADFYGAMDGGSKFVRGDAVAGLIITAINLVGGIGVGVIQQGLDAAAAVDTYSILTIGDGLVAQIPALVVSTAAGLVISRASGRSEFGKEVAGQLFGGARVLALAGAFLLVLGLLPGMPLPPFAVLGGAVVWAARRRAAAEAPPAAAGAAQAPPAEPTIAETMKLDTIVLEVGFGLLALADASRGGDVPERVKKLRRQIAQEMGFIVPPVRLNDNLQLAAGGYVIRLDGIEAARGEVQTDRLLAIDSKGTQQLPGAVSAREPVFGLPAYWIPPEDRGRAEGRGLTVVDPSTVLVTHLAEVLRRFADQILGRDGVAELLSLAGRETPKLVDDLVPGLLSRGDVAAVLKGLLSERVSIRNLRLILETLATAAPKTKDVRDLIEITRAALWRQITAAVTSPDGAIHGCTLDRHAEETLRRSLAPGGMLVPEPAAYRSLVEGLSAAATRLGDDGSIAVLVAPDDLRRPLKDLLQVHWHDLPVVSLREIDRRADLRIAETISL